MEPLIQDEDHRSEEEKQADLAAAELQKKKKKRKLRNRIILVLVLILIVGGIYGYYRWQQYQAALAAEGTDVLALADGEELVCGEVTSIIGNDITITTVDNSVATAMQSSGTGSSGGAPSGMPSAGASGEMPSAGASGEMPSMGSSGAVSGTAAAAGTDSNAAAASSETDGTDAAAADSAAAAVTAGASPASSGTTGSSATGESKDYEIPTGTVVTTRLGTESTFSAISSGDVIGIVLESGTDDILRIQIIQ